MQSLVCDGVIVNTSCYRRLELVYAIRDFASFHFLNILAVLLYFPINNCTDNYEGGNKHEFLFSPIKNVFLFTLLIVGGLYIVVGKKNTNGFKISGTS